MVSYCLNNQTVECFSDSECGSDSFSGGLFCNGALGNDVKALTMPLCLDKSGSPIENLMVMESPEVIREGQKLRYTKARKRPVYEILKWQEHQKSQQKTRPL